jgi:protein deglycase
MPKALVPLAPGVEEMEAVIIIDTLRRARWEVTAVAVRGPGDPAGAPLQASRGVRLCADAEWGETAGAVFDALVLPGGAGGTKALCADARVLDAVRRHYAAGKRVCAVCAAPLVLQAAGILKGKRATCHPGVRQELRDAVLSTDRVVVDGTIITSQGPGTSFEFALAIIAQVEGAAAAQSVRAGLVL